MSQDPAESKAALVTGANGGLGIAIAKEFLESDPDLHVYLGVRQNRERAEQLRSSYTHRCHLLTLDVSKESDWSTAFDEMKDARHTPAYLVNNAGHHDDHLLANMSNESWHSILDSHLTGCFYGCRLAVPVMMRQRFGRIINISSLSAMLPPVGQTNYAAAKAGLLNFSRCLAKEVARSGITVNCISPGYIETDSLANISREEAKALKKTIPARRFGQPDEVARAAIFLANEGSGYITGSNLKIDGGIY